MSLSYCEFIASERVKQRRLHPEYRGSLITAIVNEEWKIYKKKGGGDEPSFSRQKQKKQRRPYDIFLAEEKERLRNLYPNKTKGDLQNMARLNWKQTKGSGAEITKRYGTMTNAVKKSLIARVPQFDMSQYKNDVENMLVRKKCIYCDATLRKKFSKDKGDHIFPVQDESTELPILHNFSAFTVPCCVDCNTTRGNTPIKDFLKAEKYQTNLKWFEETLFPIINANKKYYKVDEASFNHIIQGIYYDLERTRRLTEELPIMEQ